MARPLKQRCIGSPPRTAVFKPLGIPLSHLDLAVLSLDELEAIRLADYQGYTQEQAAVTMNVSRPTFGRILAKAHRTIAEALSLGKALRISGGEVRTGRQSRIRCRRCHRAWQIPLPVASTFQCPRCPAQD